MTNTTNTAALSERLAHLRTRTGPDGISWGAVVEEIGDEGFGLLLVLLALPSALPIPAAGYSTPFGIVLLALGIQMLRGRETPWLPARLQRATLSPKAAERLFGLGGRLCRFMEHLVRPRLCQMVGRSGRRFLGALVVIMAFLMILPVPLTNTAPAFVIFLIGAGLTEEDGLFCLGASLVAVVATLLYAAVLYLAATLVMEHGWDGLLQLKEAVKDLLK